MAVVAHRSASTGRLSELGLMLFSVLLSVGGYMLTQAGINAGVVNWSQVSLIAVITVGIFLALHFAIRFFAPYADPVILPIVLALNGIGLAMINRLDLVSNQPFSVTTQFFATIVAMLASLVVIFLIPDHRIIGRFTFTAMIIALVLILLPLIPGIGRNINGARIWIHLPLLGSFQPAELAKIFLAIFFAGYLTEQRDNLALAGPKIFGIHFPQARHFGPILLVWMVAVVILVGETDLGTSLLLFGLFVSMLYTATNRFSWVIIGIFMLGVAAVIAVVIMPHVTARFDTWIFAFQPSVYNRPYGSSQQLVTGIFGMASGGILGTGWGQGMPQLTPISYSDYIYTALAEEIGVTGAIAILCLYLLLCMRGIRTAYRVRDSFGSLLATGISFALAIQTFVVVGGVTRLIPVTGLTLPFVAHGGSALVCNWIMVAILIRISDATRRPVTSRPTSSSENSQVTEVKA